MVTGLCIYLCLFNDTFNNSHPASSCMMMSLDELQNDVARNWHGLSFRKFPSCFPEQVRKSMKILSYNWMFPSQDKNGKRFGVLCVLVISVCSLFFFFFTIITCH